MLYPFRRNLICFILLANTLLSIIIAKDPNNERIQNNGIPVFNDQKALKSSEKCPNKCSESAGVNGENLRKNDLNHAQENQNSNENVHDNTCAATKELSTNEVKGAPLKNSKIKKSTNQDAKKKSKNDSNKKSTTSKSKKPKRPKKPKTYGAHNIDEWYFPDEDDLVYYGPHQDPKMYPPIARKPQVEYLKEDPRNTVAPKKNTTAPAPATIKEGKKGKHGKQHADQEVKPSIPKNKSKGSHHPPAVTVHINRGAGDDPKKPSYRKRSDEASEGEPLNIPGPPEKRKNKERPLNRYMEEDE